MIANENGLHVKLEFEVKDVGHKKIKNIHFELSQNNNRCTEACSRNMQQSRLRSKSVKNLTVKIFSKNPNRAC